MLQRQELEKISDSAIKRQVHKRGWQQNTFDLGIHRLHVSEQFEEHLHRLKDARTQSLFHQFHLLALDKTCT